MATVNRFDDLVNAPAEDRKQIAERLYDETYAKRLRQSFKAPTREGSKKSRFTNKSSGLAIGAFWSWGVAREI